MEVETMVPDNLQRYSSPRKRLFLIDAPCSSLPMSGNGEPGNREG